MGFSLAGAAAESDVLSRTNKNLALWLNAEVGVELDTNGCVQKWVDQSGYRHDAIQLSPSARPRWFGKSGPNVPTLRFDGASSFLEIRKAQNLAATNDLAIFAVVKLADAKNSTNSIFSKTSANLPAPFDLYLHPPEGELRLFTGDGIGYSYLFGKETIRENGWRIVSVVIRGTNAMTYLDGNFNGSKAMPVTMADAGGALRIGTRDDFAHWLNGDLAELIFFRSSITDADRIAIHQYLGEKHGIQLVYDLNVAEHPVVGRLEGQTATFSVSTEDPSLEYQWQKNGIDIPEATNASYTTPALVVADTGTSYRARVSALGKTKHAGHVTLSVTPDTEPLTTTTAAFLLRDQSRNSETKGRNIPPPYKSRLWQTSEEPSRSIIQSIAQTADGFLWVGTGGGIARFDGERFEFVRIGLIQNATNQPVNALCADKDGSLWVGTAGAGLFQLKKEEWINHSLPPGSESTVLTLRRMQDDSLWIGTRKGIAVVKNGAVVPRAEQNDVTPGSENAAVTQTIRAIEQDGSGDTWVAAGLEVMKFKDEAVLTNLHLEAFSSTFLRSICCSRDGSVWIGGNSGLIRFQEGKYHHFSKTNGLPDNVVTALHEDRRGNLWIGTSGGLCRYANDTFIVETTPDGEDYNQILCFFEDREENLWVGAKNGLHQLRVQQFTTYTTRQGLAHNNVISVYEDDDGAMWIGTWGGGLHCLRHGKISIYSTARNKTMQNDLVLAITGARSGGIWFAEDYGSGLYRLNDGVITRYADESVIGAGVVRAMTENGAGQLLIGGLGSLKILQNQRAMDFGNQEALLGKAIRCLLVTKGGQIWVGTDRGLALKTNDTFAVFSTEHGLSDDGILSLHEDGDDTLWIGTAKGGLNRLRSGRFTSIDTKGGLFDDEVQEILEDDSGSFWLSSRRGISRINRKELEDFAEGRISRISPAAFGKADGMNSPVCVGVAKPSAWRSKDGRLWFATTKGLAVTDPNLAIARNMIVPPVVIQRIVSDSEEVLNTKEQQRASGQRSIIIPPTRDTLEFHYTALSFSSPEKNRFKYRLAGYDAGWVEADTRHVAYYNNLPPGSYQFQVIACNNDGIWNEAGASVDLLLQPDFWQTWPFKLAIGMGGLVFVAAGARYTTRKRMKLKLQRLEQQHSLEKERARIARDIHDDIGATLTQISLLSQLAEKESGRPEQVRDYTRKITNTARDLAQAMDEIVWAINPKNDSLKHLIGYIFRFAEEFLTLTELRLRKDRPQVIPDIPVPAEVRHNVFLVVKEALNNIVRHSGAGEARLNISTSNNTLLIVIEDDGHGFVPGSDDAYGNGMGNMKKRTEEAGGIFLVTSSNGRGTQIKLTIPLP